MIRPSFRRLVVIALVVAAPAASLRAQPSLEYNVKAALLLNFARFIEWPDGAFADTRSPIHVCVAGENRFGDALDDVLHGETVGSRTFATRVVTGPRDSAGCHLLFVAAGTESRAAAIIGQRGSFAVTVGESRRFEDMGGAVTFVLDSGRVRFNVNLRPLEQRQVRVSARMLQLASRVDGVKP